MNPNDAVITEQRYNELVAIVKEKLGASAGIGTDEYDVEMVSEDAELAQMLPTVDRETGRITVKEIFFPQERVTYSEMYHAPNEVTVCFWRLITLGGANVSVAMIVAYDDGFFMAPIDSEVGRDIIERIQGLNELMN